MRLTIGATALAAALLPASSGAFVPLSPAPPSSSAAFVAHVGAERHPFIVHAPNPSAAVMAMAADGKEGNDEDTDADASVNPYADPNYPELEFVNYDDPEYMTDQGLTGDDVLTPSEQRVLSSAMSEEEAEKEVEKMREDRRRKNDEFQFETYHASFLKSGDLFRGEWELFRTSTFLPDLEDDTDESGVVVPRLVRGRNVLRMVSSGKKVPAEEGGEGSDRHVDSVRLVHEDRASTGGPYVDAATGAALSSSGDLPPDAADFEDEIRTNAYWPERMGPYDFRGEQGIMCVGNGYTICKSVPLDGASCNDPDEGPFSELRTELGIFHKKMRMRVKLDYRVKEAEVGEGGVGATYPPLRLRSMTVCREGHERWPRYADGRTDVDNEATAALFGPPGAPGGLYDPPPVGGDDQAMRYMMIDLDGGASVLFPHTIDQDPAAFDGNGWVTSLDWTPGAIRYQADRKVNSGTKIKGLRSLELSEVLGSDAEEMRPKDGGDRKSVV